MAKKTWVAPTMKKINIEQITALGTSGHPDGSKGAKS
jgi:hypothetical protein